MMWRKKPAMILKNPEKSDIKNEDKVRNGVYNS